MGAAVGVGVGATVGAGVRMVQMRSVTCEGGWLSNSSAVHTVSAVHCRSVVVVGGVDSYWALKSHWLSVAHVRSAIAVAACDSYSVAVQAVSGSHTESLVALPAFELKVELGHTVRAAQSRSE